jgi:hypothetical protein
MGRGHGKELRLGGEGYGLVFVQGEERLGLWGFGDDVLVFDGSADEAFGVSDIERGEALTWAELVGEGIHD